LQPTLMCICLVGLSKIVETTEKASGVPTKINAGTSWIRSTTANHYTSKFGSSLDHYSLCFDEQCI